MRKKILDCCITDILMDEYNGKHFNIYIGGILLLMSIYALLGYLVSASNGISHEDSLNTISTIIGASTLFPIAILFKKLKSALVEKQALLEKVTVLEDVKKDLGLSEIIEISVSCNEEESIRIGKIYDVMLKDRQGKIAYLKQIRSYVESECKTYVDIVQEDINVKKLK